MEVEEERGEAEEVALTLTLFDFYWFHNLILAKVSPPPPPPPPPPASAHAPVSVSSYRHRHSRSLSDEVSPLLPMLQVQPPPRLQTILSGKEANDVEEAATEARVLEERRTRKGRGKSRSRSRSRSKSSKSLSDLEFEELKGFMDLGFTFAEAETDPRLMSIVPGLQRLKATEPAVSADSGSTTSEEMPIVSRPYLSEAWDAMEDDRLRNWRIPVTGEGIDIKNHLKFWAQTVASTVR